MSDLIKDAMSAVKEANTQSRLDALERKGDKKDIKDKDISKLKWLGKPEQFAFLMLELVRQGYIELPISKGDGSYAKLSSFCLDHFDINTTPGNLKRAMNPGTNRVSDSIRAKFIIPNKDDIS